LSIGLGKLLSGRSNMALLTRPPTTPPAAKAGIAMRATFDAFLNPPITVLPNPCKRALTPGGISGRGGLRIGGRLGLPRLNPGTNRASLLLPPADDGPPLEVMSRLSPRTQLRNASSEYVPVDARLPSYAGFLNPLCAPPISPLFAPPPSASLLRPENPVLRVFVVSDNVASGSKYRPLRYCVGSLESRLIVLPDEPLDVPVLDVLGNDSANGLVRGTLPGYCLGHDKLDERGGAVGVKRGVVVGVKRGGAVGVKRGYTNPPANPSSHRSAILE